MRDAAAFERLRVLLGQIAPEDDVVSKQDRHVARCDRNELARSRGIAHLPAAVVQEPGDERSDRAGQALADLLLVDAAEIVRLGDGQGDDRRLIFRLLNRVGFVLLPPVC